MLTITRIDDRYFVEFNGCVVYATHNKTDALNWVRDYGHEYL